MKKLVVGYGLIAAVCIANQATASYSSLEVCNGDSLAVNFS